MKKQIPLISLCMLIAPVTHADEDINESASAEADGHVEIVNTAGSIVVTGWDKDEIEITGTLGEGTKRLDFERNGSDTLIRVVLPKFSHNAESTYLFIKVPEASSVEADGVSADIKTSGVFGEQDLETVSGDIRAQVGDQDVELQSVSGDLEVIGNGQSLDLDLDTVSGDIKVEDVGGELSAETVSGGIDLSTQTMTDVDVETVNGDIEWQGDLAAGGKIDAETINGDVDLTFADATNLDVNVESFNGRISTCLGYESARNSQYGPGNTLEFERGDADRQVRVDVLNGRVEICDN